MANFLPFEEVPFGDDELSPSGFSESQRAEIILALPELETLLDVCNALKESNNIEHIRKFAEQIYEISKRFPIDQVQDYAIRLTNQLDIFDISSIKRSLSDFEKLLDFLKQADRRRAGS